MPNYKLKQQAWLDHHVAMLAELLPYIMDRQTEYSVQELLALLAERGLHYSNPQYTIIGPALLAAGVIEAV